MYTYQQSFWPEQDLEAVSLAQDVLAPGNLLLNGTYFEGAATISFLDRGFARQVSLTSANDLSAAEFIISGVQNTTLVTVVINGPNNGTVNTAEYFDIISSISVDQAVNGVSAGTGLEGAFTLINLVSNSQAALSSVYPTNNSYALSLNNGLTPGSNYKIYESLTNLVSNGQTYLDLIDNFSLIQKGSVSNLTQIIQSSDIARNVLVQVSNVSNTSTLEMQFLRL